MRRLWIVAALWIVSPGMCPGFAQGAPHELVSLYRQSPLLAHRWLRDNIGAGHSCRTAVELLEKETGDRSFESLRLPPSQLQAPLLIRRRAGDSWEAGRTAEALRLFSEAEAEFERVGARSEALFCLFLQSEILAQQERFDRCLALLRQGLGVSRRRGYAYLTALLWQSTGFVQWFQDRLPESAESFGRALEIWRGIPFQDGIVASWNNLALLYDELGLPDRAEDCYLEALAGLGVATEREIRSQLLLNFALFSFRNDDAARALRFFALARHYAGDAPADFALAELVLNPDPPEIPPDAGGSFGIQLQIQQAARRARDAPRRAIEMLRKARREARRLGLRLFERRAAAELGEILDREGLFEEAARHYRESLDREEFLFSIDAAFPFGRAVSPFLEGWVRALVRLGRSDEARRAIHWFTRLRLLKTETFLDQGSFRDLADPSPDLLASVSANALHAPARLTDTLVPHSEAPRLARDVSVLELWPDGKQVFAWLDTRVGRQFFRLEFGEGVGPAVETLDRMLSDAGHALPPAPAELLLERLSRRLLWPLESRLRTRRLLIVPHRELQLLPLELLRLSDGTRLADRFITSYLPVADRRFASSRPVKSAPLIFYSKDLLERPTARQELDGLSRFRPQPRLLELARAGDGRTGLWIHLAGHFRFDDRFWYLSRLGDRRQGLGLTELLSHPLDCEMLVLAACDGARRQDRGFPYWMGASELLLVRGAQSLVISRWQFDEHTVPLLLEMYRLLGEGAAIDEALALARHRFKESGDGTFPAEHPLFWAGIIHVGWPGRVLSSTVRPAAPPGPSFLLVLVAVTSGLRCAVTRRRRGRRR
ncbi:MAG: CHAT domain-containing protein [Acidobacteriota bacterium]